MTTKTSSRVEFRQWITKKELQAWHEDVKTLLQDIEKWARAEKWLVDRHAKSINEDKIGTYESDELTIRVPGGNIVIEPIGRDIVGADGRVDILSFPSMNRMMLVRKDRNWRIKTDAGIVWPKQWGKA